MPDVLAEHHFPRPRVRRIVSQLLALGLMLATLAIIVQLLLVLLVGPLLCGTAFLTAVLVLPLLLRTVLHPEIDVSRAGLMLHPMLWPAQFVPWEALTDMVAHPLLYNDEAMGRVLHGKRYRPRQGAVVVLRREAKLWPVYRLVGQLAGAGNVPAFAVSNTTHTNYDGLISALRTHVGQRQEDEY
jgi:hypothetical protein